MASLAWQIHGSWNWRVVAQDPRASVSENKRNASCFFFFLNFFMNQLQKHTVSLQQYTIGQHGHKLSQIQGEGTYTPISFCERVKEFVTMLNHNTSY